MRSRRSASTVTSHRRGECDSVRQRSRYAAKWRCCWSCESRAPRPARCSIEVRSSDRQEFSEAIDGAARVPERAVLGEGRDQFVELGEGLGGGFVARDRSPERRRWHRPAHVDREFARGEARARSSDGRHDLVVGRERDLSVGEDTGTEQARAQHAGDDEADERHAPPCIECVDLPQRATQCARPRNRHALDGADGAHGKQCGSVRSAIARARFAVRSPHA